MVASELLRAIELQLKQGEAGLDGFVTVVATPTQIVRPGTDAVTTVMYGLVVVRGLVGGILTGTRAGSRVRTWHRCKPWHCTSMAARVPMA